jgi:hypothetical protein
VGVANVQNHSDIIAGTADFYSWGLEGLNDQLGRIGLRAAGAQSLDAGGGDRILVFAVNTYKGWSTPEQQEFDVDIDANNDGTPDFVVFSVDLGLINGSGGRNGQQVAAIFNLATHALRVDFFAVAATNSSTILLPVRASHLGITAANPRLAYTVLAFDLLSHDQDAFTSFAAFNAFNSSISTGQFVDVPPDAFVRPDRAARRRCSRERAPAWYPSRPRARPRARGSSSCRSACRRRSRPEAQPAPVLLARAIHDRPSTPTWSRSV